MFGIKSKQQSVYVVLFCDDTGWEQIRSIHSNKAAADLAHDKIRNSLVESYLAEAEDGTGGLSQREGFVEVIEHVLLN